MKMDRMAGTKARGTVLAGLATAVGICVLSATPGAAQQVYLGAPPAGSTVIIAEPGYVIAPEPRVVVREPAYPAPRQVIVREAPERVIVTEPMGGPYANEVYVRETAPGVLPPAPVGPQVVRRGVGEDCQTVERETASGLIQVSEWCQ